MFPLIGGHLSQGSDLGDFFAHWSWDIPTLVVLFAIVSAYAVGLRRLRSRTSYEPVTGGRVASFALGVLIVFLALVSPIGFYSDDLFFMHMTQHLLLIMFAAPLFLMANPMPVFMWSLPQRTRYAVGDLLTRNGVVRRLLVRLTTPQVALLLYTATLGAWHIPYLYDAALENAVIHYLEHLTMFGAAVLFWWPVIGPAPIRSRTSYPARILYIVLATIINTALGIVITFSGGAWYTFYLGAPGHWGIAGVDDQHLGGLLMWVEGKMMFLIVLAVVFFSWVTREERVEARWQRAMEKRRDYLAKARNG